MPGPPLPTTFAYNGTPPSSIEGKPYTVLDRVMVQTQRFYISKDTGTHKRTPKAVNIPRNSQEGKGVGTGVSEYKETASDD